MEETVLIIFSLLAAMVLLVALANRLSIPYPILLVLAGFIISLIPGLPSIELNPSLVFILFLPPILQSSAYYTPCATFAPTCVPSVCSPLDWFWPRWLESLSSRTR